MGSTLFSNNLFFWFFTLIVLLWELSKQLYENILPENSGTNRQIDFSFVIEFCPVLWRKILSDLVMVDFSEIVTLVVVFDPGKDDHKLIPSG